MVQFKISESVLNWRNFYLAFSFFLCLLGDTQLVVTVPHICIRGVHRDSSGSIMIIASGWHRNARRGKKRMFQKNRKVSGCILGFCEKLSIVGYGLNLYYMKIVL